MSCMRFRLLNGIFEECDDASTSTDETIPHECLRIYFGSSADSDEDNCSMVKLPAGTRSPKLFFDAHGKLCIIELPPSTYADLVKDGNWEPKVEIGEDEYDPIMIYLAKAPQLQQQSTTMQHLYTFMFDVVGCSIVDIEILDAKKVLVGNALSENR